MQNRAEERAWGLLEFGTRLTHIFTGSAVSIMRNTREPFGRNGKRGEEGKGEKRKKGREEFRKNFSHETSTSATLILTTGEFFTGKLAVRERKNFVRVHGEVTWFAR